LLPFPVALAISQYLAVFRRNVKSATIAAVLLFCPGGLAGLVFVMTAGEIGMEGMKGIDLVPGFLLLPILVPCTASVLLGWINWRWRETMKASAHDSPGESSGLRPLQFSLRELLAAVTVLAVVMGLAAYFSKPAQPRYAEHVDQSRAPSSIPDGASDISFCHGYRGTIAYEFTIDEQGFRDWVNSGIGSLESEAARVQIEPIKGPHKIYRYCCLTSELIGPDEATVTQGLHYSWSKEDRGVHAVFDSVANRAYYFAHSH